MLGPQFLLLSTQGGIRATMVRRSRSDITPGTGKSGCWCRRRRDVLKAAGGVPFAAYCSDPCDGRTQGTTGMFDSLPYRNDAAIVLPAIDPLAAHAARRDGRGHVRQGFARDDAGAWQGARPAVRARARRSDAAAQRQAKTPAKCNRSVLVTPTANSRSRKRRSWLPCLCFAGRRLPVPGHGGHVAGGGRGAWNGAAAFGPCPSGQPIWLDMARAQCGPS